MVLELQDVEDEKAVTKQHKTFLVIDDEKDTGWIMSRIFREHGGKVIVSRSGKEGLRKLAGRKEIDAIFLDVKLPDGNGLDVLTQIKRSHSETPVIIVTAFGSAETRREAMNRGASAFLDKPIQIEEMFRVTEQVTGA